MKVQVSGSAAETAHAWILRQIVELSWDEDAFVTEAQVATATGVSRTPVREAIMRLEAENMIRRVPHRGAFIPALSERDIDSLFEARRVIEDWAAGKSASMRAPTDRLFELIAAQRSSLSDAVEFNACDVEFHSLIVQFGGNLIFSDVYRSLRHRQLRLGIRAVRSSVGRSESVLDEHTRIARAIEAGDVEEATRAAQDHLTSTVSAVRARDLRWGGSHGS